MKIVALVAALLLLGCAAKYSGTVITNENIILVDLPSTTISPVTRELEIWNHTSTDLRLSTRNVFVFISSDAEKRILRAFVDKNRSYNVQIMINVPGSPEIEGTVACWKIESSSAKESFKKWIIEIWRNKLIIHEAG